MTMMTIVRSKERRNNNEQFLNIYAVDELYIYCFQRNKIRAMHEQ